MKVRGFFAVCFSFASVFATITAAGDLTSENTEWNDATAVFTWAGSKTDFASGTFNLYDRIWGADSGVSYVGTAAATDVPGNEDKTVDPFWRVFSNAESTGAYVAPGYVLRFAKGVGTAGALDAAFDHMMLGGIWVEAGATGYSLASTDVSTGRSLGLGDTDGYLPNAIRINENFSIQRAGVVTIYGEQKMSIAAGKTFSCNVSGSNKTVLDAASRGALRFRGEGTFSVSTLTATGDVTLDYSALASRSTPYVSGNLETDASTRFVLPSFVTAGVTYQLCSGTLTAKDGVRLLTVGNDSFYANLSFGTKAPGSVSYSTSDLANAVNRATVSGTLAWESIVWTSNGGVYKEGLPIELTLSADTVLTYSKSVSTKDILVRGNYRLTLAPASDLVTPSWTALKLSSGTSLCIRGSDDAREEYELAWKNAIVVDYPLYTEKYVRLTDAGNRVATNGSITVLSGRLAMNGSPHSFAGALTVSAGAIFKPIPLATYDLLSVSPAAKVTLNGTLKLPGVKQTFADKDQFSVGAKATLDGNGVAAFRFDPSAYTALFKSTTWSGTCLLQGAELKDFNPGLFGRAGSIVQLEGCSGNFAKSITSGPSSLVLGSATTTYPTAFRVESGWAGGSVTLDNLSGDGALVVKSFSLDGSYRICISAGSSSFTGSLSVLGEGNPTAIVLRPSGGTAVRDGVIAVQSASCRMTTASVWTAENGIEIAAGATVQNEGGHFASAVHGSGTVLYTGTIGVNHIESSAGFTDASAWTGRVEFVDATLDGCDLSRGGNDSSRLILNGASGRLASENVPFSVELLGDGLTVTETQAKDAVVFQKLIGSGSFSFSSTGTTEAGSYYKFVDVDDFTGTIQVPSLSSASVIIGNGRWTTAGALEVADGATIDSKREWRTALVHFGKTVYVRGEIGEPVMAVTGKDVDFDYVTVKIVNSEVDLHRHFKFEYDSETKKIKTKSVATPPQVAMDDVIVDYGTDFTNAIVSVNVSDFYEGYEDTGSIVAEYFVHDASGRLIGYGSSLVSDEGTVRIGAVDIPNGAGKDFRYEVSLTVISDQTGSESVLASTVKSCPGVRHDTDWFHETAETFANPSIQTGVWSHDAESAVVDGEVVRFYSADWQGVRFSPSREVDDNILTVTTDFAFKEYADFEVLSEDPPTNTVASMTLCCDEDDSTPFFAVWNPSGQFERVYSEVQPDLGETVTLQWRINTRTRHVEYSADDSVLTNSEGVSSFPIPESLALTGRKVSFDGSGDFSDLAGSTWNANLAAVVNGGKTNQYETVVQAMQAATNAQDRVVLLWDATWKPQTNLVGQTVLFDLNGHKLTEDAHAIRDLERGGCRVVDNGGGSYTIDVINFYISFAANGGGGTMEDQAFSVTNMTFNLATNRFARVAEGLDFAFWNQYDEGEGATNWADGAQIDMTPYGLTNMTLYAQWRTAVKTILVEAADEYVYIESVQTNGVEHAGVRYLQTDTQRATGVGQAIIPVMHRSDLVIRFSTDLEKRLNPSKVSYLAYYDVREDMTIPKSDLPEVFSSPVTLSPMQAWAIANGISASGLAASPFAQSSFALGTTELLTEKSVVEISDFQVSDVGCSFKVTIDDKPINNVSAVIDMIRIAEKLDGTWKSPGEAEVDVSVSAEGVVTVQTAKSGSFVKIVIPKD